MKSGAKYLNARSPYNIGQFSFPRFSNDRSVLKAYPIPCFRALSLILPLVAIVLPEVVLSYERTSARPAVSIHVYTDAGKITLTLDSNYLKTLPSTTTLSVELLSTDSDKILHSSEFSFPETSDDLILDIHALPAGEYFVRLHAIGRDEPEIITLPLIWNGQPEVFKRIKILNNFVWELVNIHDPASLVPNKQFEFFNPYDRWVVFRTEAGLIKDGELWLTLDDTSRENAIIFYGRKADSPQEVMRFLKAGRHTIYLRGKGEADLSSLIVRSIPVLQHAFWGSHPHIQPFGPYDWEFLSKNILRNVNVIIGYEKADLGHLQEWKETGKHWITISEVPKPDGKGKAAVDQLAEFWSSRTGFQHPQMDGIIVDEFGRDNEPFHHLYHQAVNDIYSKSNTSSRTLIPYGALWRNRNSAEFAKACLKNNGYVAWTRYLPEQPSEEQAQESIRRSFLTDMPGWEQAIPGITKRMLIVLGILSTTESLNIDPSVNFKVLLDMQFKMLSTHPAFFGLGGIQGYHASYTDEETLRWINLLFRHYCIEGNTYPASGEPYQLHHIINPDFEEEGKYWTLAPANESGISFLSHKGYSWLQGRYPRTAKGDTFVLLKTSEQRPNSLKQVLKDLTPGAFYSLKMITGDYQDLINGLSVRKEHVISIQIEDASILPDRRFQFVFPNNYGHTLLNFGKGHPYWMNYHWYVFKANSKTAMLTIKDWITQTGARPLRARGQQLMLNFIEIQPWIPSGQTR